MLIEARDLPEFPALFLTMTVPVPELQQLVLDIRRAHAAIFEEAGRRLLASTAPAAGRDRVRVRMAVAFGALAYLPQWYDPAGPLGPDDLAEQMADLLLGLFTAAAGGPD